jgi:hypothetical protein
LVLPCQANGSASARAREIAGILVATAGGNAAIGPVDEIEYNFDTREFEVQMVKDQIAPEARRNPDLSVPGLRRVVEFIETVGRLDSSTRDRLLLGCQWLSMAYRDPNPQDALIKLWICMEAAAMPDNKYRTAECLLANSYGVSLEEVRKKAQIGLLYRLRNKIVHAGYLPILHDEIHSLAEHVAEDLLHAVAKFPSPKRVYEAAPVPDHIWEKCGVY